MGGLLHIRCRNMCIVNGVAEVRHFQNIIQGNMVITSFLVLRNIRNFSTFYVIMWKNVHGIYQVGKTLSDTTFMF